MRVHINNMDNIEKRIILKGLTLAQVSVQIGKSRSYLNTVKRKGCIGAEPALKLAEFLGVDYNKLFEIR